MKVAICGVGLHGLEAALHFKQIGAHVVLFEQDSTVGGHIRRLSRAAPTLSMGHSWRELTSELGRQMIDFAPELDQVPSYAQFYESYMLPLWERSELSLDLRQVVVERIHKRFLNPDEDLADKSRLHDLFRVVYQTKNEELVATEMQNNPQIFQQMDQPLIDSLSSAMEACEDFDLVVDAMGSYGSSLPLGPSFQPALNENRAKEGNKILYGLDVFDQLDNLMQSCKHITIVGSGYFAALALSKLANWFTQFPENELLLVTSETPFFGNILEAPSKRDSVVADEIGQLVKVVKEKFQADIAKFEEDIREWRNLSDIQKAKTPAPIEPVPCMGKLEGYNVTSVDILDDFKELFITCEPADFRSIRENDQMVTRKTDAILCLTGFGLDSKIIEGLLTKFTTCKGHAAHDDGLHTEPGFYTLTKPNQLGAVIKNALNFFQRVQ